MRQTPPQNAGQNPFAPGANPFAAQAGKENPFAWSSVVCLSSSLPGSGHDERL